MRFGKTIGGIRKRWLIAAVAVIVSAAFIAGMYFSFSETDRMVAQERSTDLPPPDLIVTPVVPVPTMDLTKYPIKIEYVPSSGPPMERMEAKTDAGSSTKPATGNYLYLPMIERYFSLPDDVKRIRRIELATCVPGMYVARCPVYPLFYYQRGESRIAIDSVGQVFEDIESGDASAFPFFTGKEDEEKDRKEDQ